MEGLEIAMEDWNLVMDDRNWNLKLNFFWVRWNQQSRGFVKRSRRPVNKVRGYIVWEVLQKYHLPSENMVCFCDRCPRLHAKVGVGRCSFIVVCCVPEELCWWVGEVGEWSGWVSGWNPGWMDTSISHAQARETRGKSIIFLKTSLQGSVCIVWSHS